MSLVVAYKRDGVIYLGADSQVSFGDSKISLHTNGPQKIMLMPNNIIVGFAGSVANIANFIMTPQWFENIKDEVLTKEIILKHIFNPFSDYLIDQQKMKMYNAMHDLNFSMLIAKDDQLFHVDEDGLITHLNHYGAIGSGGLIAHPILKHEKGNPEKIILKALEYGEAYDQYVERPFLFINTKKLVIERKD
jgi:ATP-dependent protease HslVU (ClpYQ) peptidase subunit